MRFLICLRCFHVRGSELVWVMPAGDSVVHEALMDIVDGRCALCVGEVTQTVPA